MLTNADHDAGNVNVAVSGGIWNMNNMNQSPNPLWDPPEELKGQTGYQGTIGRLTVDGADG
jgi:hypothetical protein